ncbi:MAG: DUF493 family protein [Flavobacteriaceae bacterium]|nr:DUF493 family protein [Flavobacteriaceae bacterium]MCY4254143.1 DUF493 family protein [Flavobacteriaceae bacterium]
MPKISCLQNPPNNFENLELRLKQSQSWPGQYLFKFIVLSDSPNIEKIKSKFEAIQHTISFKKSKEKRYTSISIKAFMNTPKQVISFYKEVNTLQGVIIL